MSRWNSQPLKQWGRKWTKQEIEEARQRARASILKEREREEPVPCNIFCMCGRQAQISLKPSQTASRRFKCSACGRGNIPPVIINY